MNKNGGPEGSCTLSHPADNGTLYCLSYESDRKWWDLLVMLQFVPSSLV